MRKLTLWLIAFLLSASVAFAQPSGPGALVSEVDGTPNAFVTRIIFPNGTLTIANGAATYSGIGAAETDPVAGAINGIILGDGAGNLSAAAAGVNYLAPNGDGSALTGVDAASGDSATGFFDAGTIEHEYGGLEADVSTYDGILAITGGSTYELNLLSELNSVLSVTLLDDGDIAGSTAIGLTTGNNYTNFGVAGDDSLNEMYAAIDNAMNLLKLPLTTAEPTTESVGTIVHVDQSEWDPAGQGSGIGDHLAICTAAGSPGTWKAFLSDAGVWLAGYDATADGMSDDTYNGLAIGGLNAGEAITQWDLVFFNSADSELHQADANAAGEFPARGMAVVAGTDGNELIILTRGVVRNDGWNFATIGGTVYLSETAGGVTQTAPSDTNDCVQAVGWALSDDELWLDVTPTYFQAE